MKALAQASLFVALFAPVVAHAGGPLPEGSVIWAMPHYTAVVAGLGGLYVPIGVLHPLNERTSLSIELRGTAGPFGPCQAAMSSAKLNVGVQRRITGTRRHQGLYLGGYGSARVGDTGSLGRTDGGLFGRSCPSGVTAGLDGGASVGGEVGYHFTHKRLYLAPVLGVDAGLCVNCHRAGVGAYDTLDQRSPYQGRADLRPFLGTKIDVLRVGVVL